MMGPFPLFHLPRPLCVAWAKFSTPPLAKNKSRQKAKGGADEDETPKSRKRRSRRTTTWAWLKDFPQWKFFPRTACFSFISAFSALLFHLLCFAVVCGTVLFEMLMKSGCWTMLLVLKFKIMLLISKTSAKINQSYL